MGYYFTIVIGLSCIILSILILSISIFSVSYELLLRWEFIRQYGSSTCFTFLNTCSFLLFLYGLSSSYCLFPFIIIEMIPIYTRMAWSSFCWLLYIAGAYVLYIFHLRFSDSEYVYDSFLEYYPYRWMYWSICYLYFYWIYSYSWWTSPSAN